MGEGDDGSGNPVQAISVLRSQEKGDLTDVKKQSVFWGNTRKLVSQFIIGWVCNGKEIS